MILVEGHDEMLVGPAGPEVVELATLVIARAGLVQDFVPENVGLILVQLCHPLPKETHHVGDAVLVLENSFHIPAHVLGEVEDGEVLLEAVLHERIALLIESQVDFLGVWEIGLLHSPVRKALTAELSVQKILVGVKYDLNAVLCGHADDLSDLENVFIVDDAALGHARLKGDVKTNDVESMINEDLAVALREGELRIKILRNGNKGRRLVDNIESVEDPDGTILQ